MICPFMSKFNIESDYLRRVDCEYSGCQLWSESANNCSIADIPGTISDVFFNLTAAINSK